MLVTGLYAQQTFLAEGKLRALTVTLPNRSAALPQVPTMAEVGLSQFSIVSWNAVVGPPRMAPEIVERWNRELIAALAGPEVVAAAERQAFQITGSSPAKLAAFMKEQFESYRAMLKAAGVEPE